MSEIKLPTVQVELNPIELGLLTALVFNHRERVATSTGPGLVTLQLLDQLEKRLMVAAAPFYSGVRL